MIESIPVILFIIVVVSVPYLKGFLREMTKDINKLPDYKNPPPPPKRQKTKKKLKDMAKHENEDKVIFTNHPIYIRPEGIQHLFCILEDIEKYNDLGDVETKDALTDGLIRKLEKGKGSIIKIVEDE